MKYSELVKIIENELEKDFGIARKNVNHKYIVETKCKYELKSGGVLKIKLLGDKIQEVKGNKDCNEAEMQEFVNKLKNILKEMK